MRIALYVDSEAYGGVLTYTTSLSSALREAGVKTIILTHEPSGTISKAIATELEACGDECRKLPLETNVGRDARLLWKSLEEARADIFVPNYRMMPYAAAAYCSRHSSIRSIGVCHNDHASAYDLLEQYESCLTRFVCASTTTATQLKARMPWRSSDVANIPHGVSVVSRSCEPFQGGKIQLIYHGRLVEEQKRVSLLLEIARRLSAKQVPFHLTLVGDGPDIDQYRVTIRQQALDHCISIYGSESWSSLGPRLGRSHVAVLTSEYEGFCLSLAEGMGAGLPSVAFQCGGVIEQFLIHDQTGLLVEGVDIDAFVASIARLQADPGLWSRMSHNARSLIEEKYSWSTAVKEYVNLFEASLSDPTHRRWPMVRPAWMKAGGRSLRSIVERIGKEVGFWR